MIQLLHCDPCRDITEHVRLTKNDTIQHVCQQCGGRRKAGYSHLVPKIKKAPKEKFPTAQDYQRLFNKRRPRVHICLAK